MRNCKHCGEVKGRFFNRHGECKKQHTAALNELIEHSTECALGILSFDELNDVRSSARLNFVTDAENREALISGFEEAVSIALDDSLVSELEERHLNEYKKNFDLSERELDRNGAHIEFLLGVKSREVSNGQMPYHLWESRVDDLPFRLQESEKCVWIFREVKLETKSTYEWGVLTLTTKGLYFVGNSERHRIPYGRIFNLSREWNGFSVNQGSATKTYTFENGWFAWKLLNELVKKE